MKIMRGVAHARRVDVDGPHLLLKTRPQECAAAVLEFIREVRKAGPVSAARRRPGDLALVLRLPFLDRGHGVLDMLSGFNAVYRK